LGGFYLLSPGASYTPGTFTQGDPMTDKSEFFTPLEFLTQSNPAEQKSKTKVVWDENLLADAKEAIDKEVARIRVGTSHLTKSAVDNGKFGIPCETALKTFFDDPSDFTFARVKDLASQDYGSRVGDHFVSLLKKARKEVTDE
jgi:hypothetical protein